MKRANGTGSIHRLKNGRFWARVYIDGKRVGVGCGDTVEEAEALVAAAKAKIEAGEALVAKTIERTAESFVYFAIEDVPGGFVKIGRARNPAKRMLSLQTGTPRPLRLLCVIQGGAQLEAALHAAFAADRMSGEWFRASPRLLALARELAPLVAPSPAPSARGRR